MAMIAFTQFTPETFATTGTKGLDNVLSSGLPSDRPTIVSGSGRCGKTMLAMEFLERAINSIGAKRVVLDTVEALFAGLPNHSILRAELRRLFRWLKDRGMTAVVNIRKICEEHLEGRYDLEIVGISQKPTLAEGELIIAAPTLTKNCRPPAPLHRRHVKA